MGQDFAIFNLAVGFVILAALIILHILPLKMLKEFWQWLVKTWNSFPSPARFIIAIISFIAFAFGIMFIYKFHGWFDIIFLSKKVKSEGVSLEDLSNIRRNIWLLGFAIFGGCLAIWARLAHERQLKYTQKQLENSAEINRNDRFAKAVELLGKKGDNIASKGGLYMLRDLAHESPNTEYIRCVEIISYWLLQHKGTIAKDDLLNITLEIFKIKNINTELEKDIGKYKKIKEWSYWPYLEEAKLQKSNLQDAYLRGAYLHKTILANANLQDADLGGAYLQYANLQGANLKYVHMGDTDLRNADLGDAKLQDAFLEHANFQGANLEDANLEGAYLFIANLVYANLMFANLQGAGLMQADFQDANLKAANLEGANLQGANLQGANITNANMRDIEDLTKEQILSAKWIIYSDSSKPPKLPDYLMKDIDVQKWLNNPTSDGVNEYVRFKRSHFFKKFVTKKAKVKKAKAKEPKN